MLITMCPGEIIKYINAIGSGMLLQNTVEIHDTQRKRREGGDENTPNDTQQMLGGRESKESSS
jgi:hypothetical protein